MMMTDPWLPLPPPLPLPPSVPATTLKSIMDLIPPLLISRMLDGLNLDSQLL
jgi:hypothetical protein